MKKQYERPLIELLETTVKNHFTDLSGPIDGTDEDIDGFDIGSFVNTR